MACFWLGILNQLKKHHLVEFNTPVQMAEYLKFLNRTTAAERRIFWNGERLTDLQIKEHKAHIEQYQVSQVHQGYWCSTCDPFLSLLAAHYSSNVEHVFDRTRIVYTPDPAFPVPRTFHFSSSKTHFQG